MSNEILYYQGISLEEYITLKNKLDANGIAYRESNKKKLGFFAFLVQLFTSSFGTTGMLGERNMEYFLYVDKKDYDKALKLRY